MENNESKAAQQKQQEMTYSDTVGTQAAYHAEALKRAAERNGGTPTPNYADGLLAATAMDMWSTGGSIDSPHVSPDLQGPTRALEFGDVPGEPYGAPLTWNFDAMLNRMGRR